MNPSQEKHDRGFVVATPQRSVCDDNARALEKLGRLRFIALGTRRGTAGVAADRTRLLPAFGLAAYVAAQILPPFGAESFRYRLHPWFDRWVRKQLTRGDHLISSYGYVTESFRWVVANGGTTLLDAGNSHPLNFWEVLSEEHARWKCPTPPVAPHHYQRALATVDQTRLVLSPSSYVTRSFLSRGFKPEQIIRNVYPVDLTCFKPSAQPRPKDRPLTLINTASLSLRKGTPYLLEAFRIIRKTHPTARLLLTRIIQDDVKDVLSKFSDLPIEWSPGLPHPQLAERLRSADIFVFPSLEDGFARTVAEALACGLPVITTPHTGASDLVQPGINGEVVPIRDPQAMAEAVLKWAEKITSGWSPQAMPPLETLSFEHFEKEFLDQLREKRLI